MSVKRSIHEVIDEEEYLTASPSTKRARTEKTSSETPSKTTNSTSTNNSLICHNCQNNILENSDYYQCPEINVVDSLTTGNTHDVCESCFNREKSTYTGTITLGQRVRLRVNGNYVFGNIVQYSSEQDRYIIQLNDKSREQAQMYDIYDPAWNIYLVQSNNLRPMPIKITKSKTVSHTTTGSKKEEEAQKEILKRKLDFEVSSTIEEKKKERKITTNQDDPTKKSVDPIPSIYNPPISTNPRMHYSQSLQYGDMPQPLQYQSHVSHIQQQPQLQSQQPSIYQPPLSSIHNPSIYDNSHIHYASHGYTPQPSQYQQSPSMHTTSQPALPQKFYRDACIYSKLHEKSATCCCCFPYPTAVKLMSINTIVGSIIFCIIEPILWIDTLLILIPCYYGFIGASELNEKYLNWFLYLQKARQIIDVVGIIVIFSWIYLLNTAGIWNSQLQIHLIGCGFNLLGAIYWHSIVKDFISIIEEASASMAPQQQPHHYYHNNPHSNIIGQPPSSSSQFLTLRRPQPHDGLRY